MDNQNIWYLYKTKSTHAVYPLEIGIKECKVSDIVYDPDIVRNCCKAGCSNYGMSGGCPPFSPKMEDLYQNSDKVWLIYSIFWSKYKPKNIIESKNIGIHWKFQDVILAWLLLKLGFGIVDEVGGNFLSSGYCMGCPGQKCNFKIGRNFCRNPQKRTYSMESTGINVIETLKKQCNIISFWYSKGKFDVPYMVKCIAYFPDPNKCVEVMQTTINVLNRLESCSEKIGSQGYSLCLKESFGIDNTLIKSGNIMNKSIL